MNVPGIGAKPQKFIGATALRTWLHGRHPPHLRSHDAAACPNLAQRVLSSV